MKLPKHLPRIAIVVVTLLVSMANTLAQETNLPQRQSGVAGRYERLEELLLRLAEMESTENPERAALLRRAARQSRDQFVLNKLQTASAALLNQRFQEAVDNQTDAKEGLESLLQLLMSEDRSKRIRDEKERIANLIKNLKRVERAERSTRSRTENGADMKEVEAEQKSITERSEALKAELSQNDDAEQEPKESSEDESSDQATPDEKETNPDKPSDPAGEKPESDSAQKPNDSKPNKPSSSKPSPPQSKPSDQQADPESESEPNPDQPRETPQANPSEPSPPQQAQSPEQLAQQQLQKAIEKMQEAEKELETSQRDKASERQREAEENLRAAIDRLERILRQLREEEMQRELAKLEARLRRMAAMQSKVLDDTVALAATPKAQRNRQTDLKAGDLAFEEKKITLEADRAMLLLREEGSSVAFPEVVSQIRLDTTHVAERLGETKIDAVTQGIQTDILAALEEMIEALQKAQRDLEKKRQEQQGEPQQGGQEEQPLVEALAELKLLRTMEKRVKTTTSRYSALLETGESSIAETLPLLQDLSLRQNRLYQIARDLVLKRNQ
ncbi:hypothetical protein [Novipirellula artificiosorum]|nr:hypothetical protein [Novipirellula artificiosorum]